MRLQTSFSSRSNLLPLLLLLLQQTGTSAAIELDIDSYSSIKAAAAQVAGDLANEFWDPTSFSGVPNAQYAWWQHGAILGAYVDYWAMTGDTTYNANITIGWLNGVAPSLDLLPKEHAFDIGNDDQGFWSIMSMDAVERVFPETDEQKRRNAGFLEITQTVHNTQATRWDMSTCGGGLRWQIVTVKNGYKYKNTISNGLYFQQSARLAKYTGNESYAEAAEMSYKWMRDVNLIQDDFWINDGADIPDCKRITPKRWSYNYGTILAGCAAMYNYTEGDRREYWKTQLDSVLNATYATFIDQETGALKEIQCQDSDTCDMDQRSFKAYLARWMGYTAQVAPYTYDSIMPHLRKNAALAAATCTGDPRGTACGQKWNIGPQWDGKHGLGEQINAMEVIQNIAPSVAPVGYIFNNRNGGTSKSNPGGMGKKTSGGKLDKAKKYEPYILPTYEIKPADRFGAAIVTILAVVWLGGTVFYVASDFWETPSKLPEGEEAAGGTTGERLE
ncbi:hydrolase 76 protein [Orbilia blumenaviensis]|uniref:Mannan endo-1,6-alpha-mannosidase n=1 Tax=Orbilia blumenaviensis TaxID=1796055 RepID=A0AAV9TYX2_9PEZI